MVERKVPNFPDHCQYLLIGAGLASLSAFKAIKTQDPKAKVIFSYFCQYLSHCRQKMALSYDIAVIVLKYVMKIVKPHIT